MTKNMKIYDDLISVFCRDWFNLSVQGGITDIIEEDKNASVKKVEFECHGQVLKVNKNIFNKTDFLYKDDADVEHGMPKLMHSCDGVLIVKNADLGCIFFIELKSDYSQTNIHKAETQIVASYLRLMALLNVLDNDELKAYKKCGIIVSHPMNDEDKTLILKKKNVKKELCRYERQFIAFASRRSFPISKIYSKLGRIPIKENMRFEELPTYHIDVNPKGSSVRFNLNDILRSL